MVGSQSANAAELTVTARVTAAARVAATNSLRIKPPTGRIDHWQVRCGRLGEVQRPSPAPRSPSYRGPGSNFRIGAVWHSRRNRCLVADVDGGTEHMIPERCGDTEVPALGRIMVAQVPGAEGVEIRGRGFVRMVMDDV